MSAGDCWRRFLALAAWDAVLSALILGSAWYLLTHWAFVPPFGRVVLFPTLTVGVLALAGEWRSTLEVAWLEIGPGGPR